MKLLVRLDELEMVRKAAQSRLSLAGDRRRQGC